MILRTPRLYLRAMRADDAPMIFAIMSDAEAMRFWDRPAIAAPGIAQSIVAEQLAAMRDASHLYWTVLLGEAGPAIGSCDLSGIDRHHARAQAGFLFRREHWGRGYGREALGAVTDYGFAALGLQRIWTRIHARNEAARRVLEACGFVREGVLRAHVVRDGERRDCEIHARLACDIGPQAQPRKNP